MRGARLPRSESCRNGMWGGMRRFTPLTARVELGELDRTVQGGGAWHGRTGCESWHGVRGGASRAGRPALAALSAAAVGCSTRELPVDGPSATNAQEIYGAGVAPDTTSTTGFRAPVVWESVMRML